MAPRLDDEGLSSRPPHATNSRTLPEAVDGGPYVLVTYGGSNLAGLVEQVSNLETGEPVAGMWSS